MASGGVCGVITAAQQTNVRVSLAVMLLRLPDARRHAASPRC